jgi:hypothetical protein
MSAPSSKPIIETSTHRCTELIDVIVIEEPRSSVSFLNWKFRPKLRICGAGVYALFYKSQLAYVGSYRGKKSSPFGGNVAKDRWWTHLASLTMRGHRISMRESMREDIPIETLNSTFQCVLKNPPKALHKPVGCVTSKNRILFANRFWEDFQRENHSSVIAEFYFSYARYTSNIFKSTNHLRDSIAKVEEQLIDELKPPCNDETTWGTPWPTLNRDESEQYLRESLENWR